MSPIILIAVLWLVVPTGTRALVTEQPEQIHLSYGGKYLSTYISKIY